MLVKNAVSLLATLALTLAALTGCNRDGECCSGSTPSVDTAIAPPAPRADAKPPTLVPPPVEKAALSAPQVTGKWIGTWESNGRKGHGGGLRCEAKEAGPGKWAAVFTAEYGPTQSYNVNLDGKLGAGVVLFGGKVDLGPRGGIFNWTGEATQTAFKGKYEGGGDTGSFQMVRAPQ
jgi:hypothetical protein